MIKADEVKFFTIQMAAEASGLSAHTIRAWEKRYDALTPVRSDTGRRMYSSQEVRRLSLLAQLTNLGSAIRQIAHLSDEELNEAYQRLMRTQLDPLRSTEKIDFNLEECREKLLLALRSYQMDQVYDLLIEAGQNVGPRTFALEILQPLNSIVEEGLVSGHFQQGQRYAYHGLARTVAGSYISTHYGLELKAAFKILVTGLDFDRPSIDPLFSALLCCESKKRVFYMNPNLPHFSLIEASAAVEANLLVLHLADHVVEKEVSVYLDHLLPGISSKIKVWIVGKSNLGGQYSSFKQVRFLKNITELGLALGDIA